MRYAILPHAGPLDSRTVRMARNFNTPIKLCSHPSPSTESSLLSSITIHGSPALILDTIKRGEDDEDVSRGELPKRKGRSIILRVYESLGGKARGLIKTSLTVKKVYRTNLLEDDEDTVEIKSGQIPLELRAFEVATFRLQL